MAVALQEQGSPVSFIEYNGYMFGTRTKSKLQCVPQPDSSGRTEIYRKYVLLVQTIVVPRRNIPGDNTALNIQANPPGVKVPIPGINPYHLAATTDSEVKLILDKLTETGKTLRFIGQGTGDIVVNTIHPATGAFIQDMNFGPHCRVTSLSPLGFNKCWKIEWECTFHIQTGQTQIDGLNELHKRVLEYNYSTEYRYDEHGYCTRTIHGRLKIVPPMYRFLNQLPTSGTGVSHLQNETAVNDFKALYRSVLDNNDFAGEAARTKVLKISNYLTTLIKKHKEDCLLLGYEAGLNLQLATSVLDFIILNLFPALSLTKDQIIANFQLLLKAFEDAAFPGGNTLDFNTYAELVSDKEDIQNTMYHVRNYIMTGLQYKVGYLAKIPEITKMFPEGTSPLNNKICYGPFPSDNVGNLQSYETADQYRELVYNSIIIPFNFKRVGHNYNIDQTQSVLSFSIVDKEQPSFSFVPGYSSVSAHQDTSSVGPGFVQFNTSISASFKLGKFTNKPLVDVPGKNNLKGYSDLFKLYPNYDERTFDKAYPSKRQAYADFLKLVLQRLCIPIFFSGKGVSVQIRNDPAGQKRTLDISKSISCIPHTFQCRENIMGDNIDFTLGYKITSNMSDIFTVTGHGLPAIIASDLRTGSDNVIIDPEAAGGLGRDRTAKTRYVAAMHFAAYTDFLVHKDWLISQRYNSNNARGCSDLIYDRTFNRPINLNILGEDLTRVIPLHGEYPSGKNISRTVEAFELDTREIKLGDYGDQVLICYLETKDLTGGIVRQRYLETIALPQKNEEHEILVPDYYTLVGGQTKRIKVKATDVDTLINDSDKIVLGSPLRNLAALVPFIGPVALASSGFVPSFKVQYYLYSMKDYKRVRPPATPLANEDVDDFQDYIEGNVEDIQSKQIITVPRINITDATDEANIDLYASSEDFIVENVTDFISQPTVENSWISYDSELEIITDNVIIRRKALPTTEVISDFGEEELSNKDYSNEVIRNNFDAMVNTGPNSLKGGSPASDLELPSGSNTDIIQTINEPAITIVLKGSAERLNWEVVPPTLLRYGGRSVRQKKRVFNKSKQGKEPHVVNFGVWYIEYIVEGQPSGFLGSPDTPFNMESLETPINNPETIDSFLLDEQQDLFEQLKGFVTQ